MNSAPCREIKIRGGSAFTRCLTTEQIEDDAT